MSREWDYGKAAYDDYYSDNKRRKFNAGGYEATQSYPEYDNFPKKRLQPSEPSPHVIFLGLDPDFNEADLQKYLVSHGCSIESVTIIRERSTGVSKGFGFACFSSIEHARTFVDPRFPFVQIPPPASHGASATAQFYQAVESNLPHNGRRVKIDFSQSANPNERGKGGRGHANDGTRDIGNSPAAVLLFRGLDPLSGTQAIYQALLSSSGHGKPGAKGMKRIILIKDKTTLGSLGFAFVEFIDIQAASAVLGATMSPQIHPAGFRVSDRPVAVSFGHPYSFQPIEDLMIRDEACIPGSMNLGGEEGSLVRYWDENTMISHLEFEVEESAQPAGNSAAPSKERKEKKKPKDVDVVQDAPAAPSTLPVSDKPVTLSFNKGLGRAGPVAAKPIAAAFALDDNAPDEIERPKAHAEKRLVPLMASKKMATNINKWNQVQEELKEPTAVQASSSLAPAQKPEPSNPCARGERRGRGIRAVDQLQRHNKESDLHKKNFKDANLREVARQKVAARKAATAEQDQPKYRDRASERRVLFNQPDVPLPEAGASRKRQADGPPPPPSPPPAPVNPGKDDSNVGNKLLKMMGWTEGSGLGTEGEGRVDPVSTAIYAQGVGLGASKGKDISSMTSTRPRYG
ncbi:RhoA GTPase effector DIA/Diaphanous [Mycena kentingensis (nom. inval.)]|nr:RhoA GTPase effector DIA/Diaphanous [Mycena kentingensis (nom. inval.)]